MKRKSSLTLTLVLTIAFLTLTTASAQKNKDPIMVYTVPAFVWGEEFQFDIQNEPMPNGFTKVDMKLNFKWLSEPYNPDDPLVNILGTAVQHVTGIERNNGVQSLHGSGVFTSTIPDKTGTITYTIGNNWDPGTGKMWAGRLRIVEGTDHFEGIKGPAELNFELMAFELYLHKDPWE